MITKFKSIDTSSLVDKVEANLIALLQQRKLKLGDSIPKELELAETLGVSRTVIREALLRLRMMGLIESKKKKGSVITSPDIFANLSKSLNPFVLDEETLKEIFEIRLVLEVGMADFIFQRITKEDIEELNEIVKKEPPITKSYLFNAAHEIAFHGKLYEISGNTTLMKFQNLLLPIFVHVHNSPLLSRPVSTKHFVSHKELVKILSTGTPEIFMKAMRHHFQNHFERLFGK